MVHDGRSRLNANRSLPRNDTSWRARARARRSSGHSGGHAGGGNASSRYSMMASDSAMTKSPCTSPGTRAVTLCSLYEADSPAPSSIITRETLNSSPFSLSATHARKSNGVLKNASTNSMSGAVMSARWTRAHPVIAATPRTRAGGA